MTEIIYSMPTPTDYLALVAQTGWELPTHEMAQTALSASLCGVIAKENDETIGMVRAVGDGVMKVYIQDMIVTSSRRGAGLGRMLMTAILSRLSETCPRSCMIGLFAAEGRSEFYTRLGFHARPDFGFGPGMHGTLSELAKSNCEA